MDPELVQDIHTAPTGGLGLVSDPGRILALTGYQDQDQYQGQALDPDPLIKPVG